MAYDIDKIIHEYGDMDFGFTAVDETEYEAVQEELKKESYQKDITVEQVYACMIAVKLSRLIETPDHEDSWIDICGYAALGGEKNER